MVEKVGEANLVNKQEILVGSSARKTEVQTSSDEIDGDSDGLNTSGMMSRHQLEGAEQN